MEQLQKATSAIKKILDENKGADVNLGLVAALSDADEKLMLEWRSFVGGRDLADDKVIGIHQILLDSNLYNLDFTMEMVIDEMKYLNATFGVHFSFQKWPWGFALVMRMSDGTVLGIDLPPEYPSSRMNISIHGGERDLDHILQLGRSSQIVTISTIVNLLFL
jgi:hypothetical protein